jgi:hypothetical protein
MLSRFNGDYFFNFNNENRSRHSLILAPLSFGTAKVRTFFVCANFIFYFLFAFMNNPLFRLRAAKVSRLLDYANALQ